MPWQDVRQCKLTVITRPLQPNGTLEHKIEPIRGLASRHDGGSLCDFFEGRERDQSLERSVAEVVENTEVSQYFYGAQSE
jgi:hypothetical protein